MLDTQAIFRLGAFGLDALVTATAAWLLTAASGPGRRGVLEAALAWALCFVALVTGAGVVLGETGGFGASGFLVLHLAMLAALVLGRWSRLAADGAALRARMADLRRLLGAPGGLRWLMLAFGAVLAGLTLIAAWAEPAVFDALTYRLPRMAHWLQDGRIQILATEDARLNFVAGLTEVVGAWLLGATVTGFRFVALSQALGGLLAIGATVGLARASGLARPAALFAGTLLLGMANVMTQFTSVQTDLFTTGVFAAAFYLWWVAWRRGEISAVGLAGVGLALGAKGTLFYLAPGALIWIAYLVFQHRGSRRQWAGALLLGAGGVLFFAGPGFFRNWRAYGDPLGPAEWVKKHHAGLDPAAGLARKLGWNLGASLAQNCEPHAQPWPLRALARAAGTALAETLPENDPYTLDGLNRRATLHRPVLESGVPDADVAAFGLVPLGLFVVGMLLAAVRGREPDARLVLVWAGGVVAFGLFFHAMHQWHPFAFRYLALAAPWIAVVGAWGLEQLGPRVRAVAWAGVLLATGDVAAHVVLQTHQSGWRAVVAPEHSRGYFVTQRWRAWSEQLPGPLSIALPGERLIAAFYRQETPRLVLFVPHAGAGAATAEALVRDAPGWVIVPAARFLGAEGRVATRTWLFGGRVDSPFSLAAYRRLAPGEEPTTAEPGSR